MKRKVNRPYNLLEQEPDTNEIGPVNRPIGKVTAKPAFKKPAKKKGKK